jgi:uncharacterized protein (DUF952 family)
MIYHITPEDLWKDQSNREYFVPLDFVDEGFIHCCTVDQIDGVLERYFSGVKHLLKLHIDETKLNYPVRYEKGVTGEEFPHIYGRINKTAVEKVTVVR